MSKHRKTSKRLDPDDVLEGRARPDARELIALIHEVNPSGHDHLPARETARRYAQKSRLQSLLIHRFGDDLLVEPTDEEGVIGLRHRASGVDACHAVLASLDDEARSWAQERLDLGGEDVESVPSVHPREMPSIAPPSDAPLDELSTSELIRRGRDALEAYDYPAARERFDAALERGSREAAALLVTVLAEQLGLDDDALALEERLDDDTLAAPEVRLPLAQAAARTYQRERAVRLARRDTGETAAGVFVALCRGALERDDLDSALGDVAEVQRRDPAHPALLGLTDAVKKRRADARAPFEAEARRLLDDGRFDEAEAKAAAIAAQWPESTVARSIARACEEERKRSAARDLAREGSLALEAGEPARAMSVLRRAIAMGLSGEDAARAEQDLARAEVEERARQAQRDAREVARLMREGQTQRGIIGYVALGDELRHALLQELQMAELVYAEQIGVRGDAKQVAQAVMALMRALSILQTDPRGALELVTPYAFLLERVPNAVELFRIAQKSDAIRRQTEALERHTAAMGAFDGTDEGIERFLRLLGQVSRDDLPDSDRALLDAQVARMHRERGRMSLGKEIGRLRKAGHLASARDVVDQAIRTEEANRPAFEEGEETPDWHKIRDDINRDLAKAARTRTYGAPARDALLGVEAPNLRDVPASLLPGGTELLLAEVLTDRVLVQIVDVASGTVTRRASLRMNHGFSVYRVQQSGERAVLLGSMGIYLALDPRSWTLGTAVSTSTEQAAQAFLAPGGRFVWTTHLGETWWTTLTVYDLKRKAKARDAQEPATGITVRPLFGLEPPRVAVVHDRGRVQICEARGAPVASAQEGLAMVAESVVVHPSGNGLFGVLREGDAADERLRWAELTPFGTPVRTPEGQDQTLATLDPGASCRVAIALDARIVFILGTGRDGGRRLLSFAMRDGSLAQGFDVEVPPRVTLATDGGSRVVTALCPHDEGIEVVRLGADPPVFRVEAPTPPLGIAEVNLTPLRACVPRSKHLWSVTRDGARMPTYFLDLVEGDDRKDMIGRVLGPDPDDRALVVPRLATLWEIPDPAFANQFSARALERYPGDPEMEQLPAQRAALAGDWAAVRERLGKIDPEILPDAPAQHHDHLLGVALLQLGDVDEARRVLARGAARAGGWCDLSAPLALVGLPSPCAGVRLLADAVRAADARLAAGDPRGARLALAGLAVREAREVQALARLCRAWLSEPDEPEPGGAEPGGAEVDGFARRFALACFLAGHAEKSPLRRRELPLPGSRWDTATLDALAGEAQAWLDRDVAPAKSAG